MLPKALLITTCSGRSFHGISAGSSQRPLLSSAALTPVTLNGHPLGVVGLAGFVPWMVWIASVSGSVLRPSDRQVGVAPTPVSAAA